MRKTEIDGAVLDKRTTLDKLLNKGVLHDVHSIAEITGYCIRYVRQLCREKKVPHYRLLGRYYMAPQDIKNLLERVEAQP